jgi:photosystem II stability/assembly factor-like uncharacterized protein
MNRILKLLSIVIPASLVCTCSPSVWLSAEPISPQATEAPASTVTPREDASLRDVVFADREWGWVVGEHGTIWHTTDGGAHWQQQHTGTHIGLHGVSFVDRQRGWAVGGETRPYLHTSQALVLRTADGGKTWQSQLALLPAMADVKFFDADHGVAWGRGSGGEPLGVFTSDDGGRNWRSFAVGPTSAWWGGDFPDQRGGVVAGPHGQFAQLAHGDYLAIERQSRHDIRDVRLAPDGTGWAVGTGGSILRSTDGGQAWHELDVMPEDLRELITWNTIATHGSHVWIAGSPGTVVLHSPDKGKSWQGHATGGHTPLHKMTFVDDTHGWAVGDLGTIFHTSDGGQTWLTQRLGGERAAVLILASDEHQLPLATLAKLSADGYRTVVHLFKASDESDPTQYARLYEALTNLGCNCVTQTKISGDTTEGILVETVRQLRIWRPAVVIGPAAEDGLNLAKQIASAIEQATGESDTDDPFPALTEQLALPSWQVSRVFALAAGKSRGTHRVDYTAAVPQTGQTLAEVATTARSLLARDYSPSPATDEFQLKASFTGEPTASLDDLAAGLNIAHGSDCRRPQPVALPFDAQVARRLAEKRRNLANIFRFAEGNPALLAQVGEMTSDLDEGGAAALLFELAAQFQQTNQTQLAADTLNLLARRFPNAPVTDQALTWLVEFYASSETAHAYRANSRELLQAAVTPDADVQQASALMEEDAAYAAATFAQQRYTHAVQLVEHIAHTRPLLYSEPQIRVPWAMAERRRNFPDAADRYLASLAIRYPGDEWQECGAVEQWLADRSRPQPAKPRIDCRFVADRPLLDGTLDEPCWQAEWTELAAEHSAIRNPQSAFTFAYDEQYLYLAVRCKKASELDYAIDNRPRIYDADLTGHDHVRVRVDVDRDYTTYFSLTVDHRGWTNDACWGDTSWNPKWFIAAGGDADQWTAEAAIPWAELTAIAPATGTAWAVSYERILPKDSQRDGVNPSDFSVLLLK